MATTATYLTRTEKGSGRDGMDTTLYLADSDSAAAQKALAHQENHKKWHLPKHFIFLNNLIQVPYWALFITGHEGIALIFTLLLVLNFLRIPVSYLLQTRPSLGIEKYLANKTITGVPDGLLELIRSAYVQEDMPFDPLKDLAGEYDLVRESLWDYERMQDERATAETKATVATHIRNRFAVAARDKRERLEDAAEQKRLDDEAFNDGLRASYAAPE
jgi:hypothetical protein